MGSNLDSTINEVALMDRKQLLSGANRRDGPDDAFKCALDTSYSTKHFALKKIIKKHKNTKDY